MDDINNFVIATPVLQTPIYRLRLVLQLSGRISAYSCKFLCAAYNIQRLYANPSRMSLFRTVPAVPEKGPYSSGRTATMDSPTAESFVEELVYDYGLWFLKAPEHSDVRRTHFRIASQRTRSGISI